MANWFITGVKKAVNWAKSPTGRIVLGGLLCGTTGVAASWGSQYMNKGIAQAYGDWSPESAAQSAKVAYNASQVAIKAANSTKKTAADCINLCQDLIGK